MAGIPVVVHIPQFVNHAIKHYVHSYTGTRKRTNCRSDHFNNMHCDINQDNITQHNSNHERRQMPTNEQSDKGHNVKSGNVTDTGMKCPSVQKTVTVWYKTIHRV